MLVSWLPFVGGELFGFHVSICVEGSLPTFAVHCGLTSAACCRVRVPAGCGPNICCPDSGAENDALTPEIRKFDVCSAASPRAAAALEEATHTSRAALRPGTAAIVKKKRSAGLDCASVSPLGSVEIPGSQVLVLRRRRERMRGVRGGPGMIHIDGIGQSLSRLCCQVSFARW